MAEDRVTKTWLETLTSSNEKARVTKTWLESLVTVAEGTLVSKSFVEVLIAESDDPDPGAPVADDTISNVVFPTFEADGDPPTWITHRGQDVRAYDFASERLVWGPLHPLLGPDDLGITNGLLRCRFAAQGLAAHCTVEAFRTGEWRDMGTLYLTDPGTSTELLQRVRLVKLTPDEAVVCCEIRQAGPVWVTLRRGERMFRITHGTRVPPYETRTRQIRWSGSPSGGLSNGRIQEAVDGDGLQRALATLDGSAAQTSGGTFGLTRSEEVFEVAAIVAVDGASKDDVADHHAHYAADCEQEMRIR